MIVAFVGLGGNLGDVPARLAAAVDAMRRWPDVADVAVSSLVRTAPVGPVADQPDFINAVARVVVDDAVTARALLDRLLALEADLGRVRTEVAKGPRAIDLDLLVFGDLVSDADPRCIVPHPALAHRAFALRPLAELAGEDFAIPGAGLTVGEALAQPAVASQRVEPLSS